NPDADFWQALKRKVEATAANFPPPPMPPRENEAFWQALERKVANREYAFDPEAQAKILEELGKSSLSDEFIEEWVNEIQELRWSRIDREREAEDVSAGQ